MKELRILQLASFKGNIGDNANHQGTRRELRNNLNEFSLNFEDLEIRDFFRGDRLYDEAFAAYVNTFDLFIVGGGNFFELWVDHSCNNTSVDISVDLLKIIKTPTVFYALGLDVGMGVSDAGIAKFTSWLDYVISQDRFLLSLRNDGAYQTALDYLGEKYAQYFHRIPDGGFFFGKNERETTSSINDDRFLIGVNIAGDMLDLRFDPSNGQLDYDGFLKAFSQSVESTLLKMPRAQWIFFAHIYKDLKVISDLLHTFPDKISRNRVSVAPYLQGDSGSETVFSGYAQCDVVLANRFHANVCAMAAGVPVIGLINYPQIANLYGELNISRFAVDITQASFPSQLSSLLMDHSTHPFVGRGDGELVSSLRLSLKSFHLLIKDQLLS